MIVVVCRAFFKSNSQKRTLEEDMWTGTWMTRLKRQPLEEEFWSDCKEACLAGSQRWGRWEKQAQVRLVACDWRWRKYRAVRPCPYPRRGAAACLPSRFLFCICWLSYCPSPIAIFIPVQALHLGTSVIATWWSLRTRRRGK